MNDLLTPRELDQYLQRIAYDGARTPTLDTLRALHRAHMLAVPFENLDISLGRAISLEKARLFDKIVHRRRGGFCYELNGLFAMLLRTLGFEVALLAARVFNGAGQAGIEFDHLALRVQLDESWLADVGFGASFSEPLRLDARGAQWRDGRAYQIAAHDAHWLMQEMEDDGSWAPRYLFDTTAYRLADFAGGCHYHQTSPDSPFTRRRVCTRATPTGRITLSDQKLVITQDGVKTERALHAEDEIRAVLRDYFQLELDDAQHAD